MKISIEVDQAAIEQLIRDYVEQRLGRTNATTVTVYVKSKNNFRNVWEPAAVIGINGDPKEHPSLKRSLDTILKAEVTTW